MIFYAVFILGFLLGSLFRSCLRVEFFPCGGGGYHRVWFGIRHTGIVWQGHDNSMHLQYVDRSKYCVVNAQGHQETLRRNLVTGVKLFGLGRCA